MLFLIFWIYWIYRFTAHIQDFHVLRDLVIKHTPPYLPFDTPTNLRMMQEIFPPISSLCPHFLLARLAG